MKKKHELLTEKYFRGELLKVGWTIKKKTCYVSKRTDNLEMHHSGKTFSEILKMAHELTGMKHKKYITQYNRRDVAELRNKFIELHYKECRAITLNKEVHKEFHKIYKNDVSHDNLNEFIAMYNTNHNIEEVA